MTARMKFDARKMMEKAVEVMKASVAERRSDGKTSPRVGAVLVKSDGTFDTAFRGEQRAGDHAEFTLLDRKHRNESLDGAVIFATLEPCAPGARKSPKCSCAERIVNARLAEVWVGIEDPDPLVDRQGIRFLEDNGIKVQLFDLDLQEEIRAANEKFIEEALERAAVAKAGKFKVPRALSQWDEALAGVSVGDLAPEALARYREKTKIADKTTSPAFLQRLERQGLLRRAGAEAVPTGFGFLLLGKAPRDVLHQAGLNATIEYPDGSLAIENFEGPAILIPDQVEAWLQPKLPSVIDRSRMTREERPTLPFELIREAVINALVHRDYDLVGATCHLVVTADTVTVRSPGAPLPPITLEQLQDFKAPMYNRNPKLQFAFGGTKLVEGRGLGMRSLAEAASKYGLPVPTYDFDQIYLNLTIYRHGKAAVDALDAAIVAQLSRSELEGWQWISSKGGTKSREYAAQLGIDDRTARRHLNQFVKLGLLQRTGVGPSTEYKLR